MVLHDKQRELDASREDLLKALGTQPANGGNGGDGQRESAEAKLHAFVNHQARQLTLARNQSAELERRLEVLPAPPLTRRATATPGDL